MTNWEDILERLERWKDWDDVRKNEQATIMGLVLPVLRLIGYDVDNPEIVYPQMRLDNKDDVIVFSGNAKQRQLNRPDFALYTSSRRDREEPYALLEAKKLAESVQLKSGQLHEYVKKTRAKLGIITNGRDWIIVQKLDDDKKVELEVHLNQVGAEEALVALLSPKQLEPNFRNARQALIRGYCADLLAKEDWQTLVRFKKLPPDLEKKLEKLREMYKAEKEYFDNLQLLLANALKGGTAQPPPEWRLSNEEGVRQIPSAKIAESKDGLPAPARDWKNTFIQLVEWAYLRDKGHTLLFLKEKAGKAKPLFSQQPVIGEGERKTVLTRPLPDGFGHYKTNHNPERLKQLMTRLGEYFPELRGLHMICNGEPWNIP